MAAASTSVERDGTFASVVLVNLEFYLRGNPVIMFISNTDYPESADFISPLPEELIARLHAVGWNLPRTVFLQIPLTPITGVGAGLVRDYEHLCYWRVFCATDGALSCLTNDELRFIADHEQSEVLLAEQEANEENQGRAFVSEEEEHQRHQIEFADLDIKYGNAIDTAITKVKEGVEGRPVIPRYVALFWYCVFLTERYEAYQSLSIPMPEAMRSPEQRRRFMSLIAKVALKEYSSLAVMKDYARLYTAAAEANDNHP